MYLYIHTYIHTYIHVCVCVCVCGWVWVRARARARVCVCVCVWLGAAGCSQPRAGSRPQTRGSRPTSPARCSRCSPPSVRHPRSAGSRWGPPSLLQWHPAHASRAEWRRFARRLEWARERFVCAPREDRGRVRQARQRDNARSLPAGPRVRNDADHPPVAGARPSTWMRMRMHPRMKLRLRPSRYYESYESRLSSASGLGSPLPTSAPELGLATSALGLGSPRVPSVGCSCVQRVRGGVEHQLLRRAGPSSRILKPFWGECGGAQRGLEVSLPGMPQPPCAGN